MPQYALAVVPADWDNEKPLLFSEVQYQDIRDKLEPGTRVLLYRNDPEDAVIGLAQVHSGAFQKTSEWPQQNLGNINASDPAQAYALPLEVVFRLHTKDAQVSGERVREVLDDSGFPHGGERWRVLTPEQYNAVRPPMP